MIVIGADTHKRSHTRRRRSTPRPAGCSPTGRSRPSGAAFDDAAGVGARPGRRAGLGDRGLPARLRARWSASCSRRGERVVRVAPKLMAGARRSARERGKSDAIDAVAIASAAIREGLDTLPVAQLAGPELDIRLLVDHRERLVAQRTALINDLRWHLHDLWPEFEIPAACADHRPLARARRRAPAARRADRARADRARRAASHPRAHQIDRRPRARARRRSSPISRRGCWPSQAAAC